MMLEEAENPFLPMKTTPMCVILRAGGPTELGYAQELWTVRSLWNHIRQNCIDAGYPNLSSVALSTGNTILNDVDIKPTKSCIILKKENLNLNRK